LATTVPDDELAFQDRVFFFWEWSIAGTESASLSDESKMETRATSELRYDGRTGRFAYRVEQDVGGLEVAVDHRRVGVVEEGEALGGAHGDLHPRHPREAAVDACSEKDVSCEFVSSPALTNIKQEPQYNPDDILFPT